MLVKSKDMLVLLTVSLMSPHIDSTLSLTLGFGVFILWLIATGIELWLAYMVRKIEKREAENATNPDPR